MINKIDLISAHPDEVAEDISSLLGTPTDQILRISAKEGTNVAAVLEAIVRQIPPLQGDTEAPLRALIFDSHYDSYKGVVAYVRIMDGQTTPLLPRVAEGSEGREMMRPMASGVDFRPVEIGKIGRAHV